MVEYRTEQQKRKFYDSWSWRKLSKQIKQRDNYECQRCKKDGRVSIDDPTLQSDTANRKKIQLVVHHKKELEDHPELALEVGNLETICVDCHNKEHNRFFERKQNKWSEDEKW